MLTSGLNNQWVENERISQMVRVSEICLLSNWFARKNVVNTVIFVKIFTTGTNQVCLGADNPYFNPSCTSVKETP